MNVWGDTYPDNLNTLLAQSKEIAQTLLEGLKNPDLPHLSHLYQYQGNYLYKQQDVFNRLGAKPNRKFKETDSSFKELMGLYLFGEQVKDTIVPVYIGISRTIYRRLRQHGWGKRHNESTLAYLMANQKHFKGKFANERKDFPSDLLEASRMEVRNFKVAIYPILNDYEMYFHEVAIAAILKTKYNSFKTH